MHREVIQLWVERLRFFSSAGYYSILSLWLLICTSQLKVHWPSCHVLAICTSCLVRCPFMSFAHVLIEFFPFCVVEFWELYSFLASVVAQMVKNLPAVWDTHVDPWVGKIPWRRAWLPTPVFLPAEFHGQRSLAGYSPWGPRESDTAERLTLSLLLCVFQVPVLCWMCDLQTQLPLSNTGLNCAGPLLCDLFLFLSWAGQHWRSGLCFFIFKTFF